MLIVSNTLIFCQDHAKPKKVNPTDGNNTKNIGSYEKVNLGTNVNSKDSELGPLVSPDGNTLYFTRSYYVQSILHQEAWYC